MMPAGNLVRMVAANTLRSRRHFVLSAFGIVIGIATFVAFPAFGRGSFEGNDLKFEVGGFADGINPDYVQDDDRTRELFKDWDGVKDDPRRQACVPPPPDPNEEVIQSPRAAPKSPKPGVYYNPCPSPERYYCDDVDR